MSYGALEARQRLGSAFATLRPDTLRVLLHRFVGRPHARPASIFPSVQFAQPKSGGAPAAVQNLADFYRVLPGKEIAEFK